MSKTQAQLLDELRIRLDEATSRQWTDAILRGYINNGADDIARRTETLLDRGTIAGVAGTQEYTITTRVIRIHRVEWKATGDSNVYPLEYRDFNNMDAVWWAHQTVTVARPELYTLWGFPPSLKLVLYPTPDVGGTIKYFYYRLPAVLATASAADANVVVECPEGWEDAIVDYAEYMALRRDADPRWQEARQLYEAKIGELYDNTRRWSDASGMIVGEGGMGGIPAWLYNGD